MKKLKKVLLLMALAAGVMFTKAQDAKADDRVSMLKFDKNSITITCNFYNNEKQRGFLVYDEELGRYISENNTYRTHSGAGMTITSIELDGVPTGYATKWSVYAKYDEDDGTVSKKLVGTAEVNTTPADIPKSDFMLNYMYNDGSAAFWVDKPEYATKVQIEVYNAKNKKVATRKVSESSGKIKLSSAMGYKYRARSYYTNKEKGKTYYGKWSSYKYFAKPSVSLNLTTKTIKTSIKKGTGIASYTVYISTKPTSGYKKVKTVKVGKKSKYNVTMEKYGKKNLKKGGFYYIRVVPKVKFGSKTYASDSYYSTGVRLPR